MLRRLFIFIALGALLLLAVPASAAPPGSSDEAEKSAWFDAQISDGQGTFMELHVQTDQVSATGAEMWVSMDSPDFGCNDMYTPAAVFDYSPDQSTVTARLHTTCWNHGEIGEPFDYSFVLTVQTLDQAAKKIRWRTNATGSQCKGIDYVDDDIKEIDWAVNDTLPGFPPVVNDVGGSNGNFHSTSQVCHLTGGPGKPPKA
jgi:hypothetical protein